jgi:UDP-N-acetylmuramoyl-L-alanyl-D-glutamate--2,6-diaminopimelate ligase
MKMVGITGTSGKTTTTYMVESILQAAGHRVGVIGTVNFRVDGKVLPSTHTTPGSEELQALLRQMKNAGCTVVVMEVSSHALKQHRTAGIAFDAVAFGNLTPEHLDFHADMEDYFQSKRLLFTKYVMAFQSGGKKTAAVINVDDPAGSRLVQDFSPGASEFWGVSLSETEGVRVCGAGLKLTMEGISGTVALDPPLMDPVQIELKTSLIARFNAYNALLAVGVAAALKVDLRAIEKGMSELQGVPGRLR